MKPPLFVNRAISFTLVLVDLLLRPHSRFLRVNRSKWLFALLLWSTLFFTGVGAAQTLRINEIEIGPGGQVALRHPADPAYYYILYRGVDVLQIFLPADVALGISGVGELTDRQPSSAIGFYRVEQIPISSPKDTDGDGIDDVWELQRPVQLNPLLASDAQQPSAGPGSPTWKQLYDEEREAALAAFASFSTTASTNLVTDSLAEIRVTFSKPYVGPLRFQVGGTALAGQDYSIAGLNAQTSTGQVSANGTEVIIPVIPMDQSPINRDQTVTLTLIQPTNASSYRLSTTNGVLTHSLLFREGDQGIFAGTIAFTNDVVIGAQSIKVALRTRDGGVTEAYVDALNSSFFRTSFSFPAFPSADGTSISFPDPVTRTIHTNGLGRPLTWTLRIDPASLSNNVFNAAVRMELQGLTTTSFTLDARGTLVLTRLDATL